MPPLPVTVHLTTMLMYRPRVRAELAALVLDGHRCRLYSGYRRFGRRAVGTEQSELGRLSNSPGRLRRRRGGRRPSVRALRSPSSRDFASEALFFRRKSQQNADSDKQENVVAADFFMENTSLSLFHQVDRLVQFRKRFGIPFLDGVDDAMVHMVAQNYFADVVGSRCARRQAVRAPRRSRARRRSCAQRRADVRSRAPDGSLRFWYSGAYARGSENAPFRRHGRERALRGMHGFRMFHNVSPRHFHVLRGNAQHHSFRFPGIELYLDQRVAAHRRHLFDHALTERLMYHAVALFEVRCFRRGQDGLRLFRSRALCRAGPSGACGL